MSTHAYIGVSGSAGKTTSLAATAVKLAEEGYTVDVCDLDLQANPTAIFGYLNHAGPTVADVISGKKKLRDVRVPARLELGYNDEGQPVYDMDVMRRIRIIPTSRKTMSPLAVEVVKDQSLVIALREAFIAEAEEHPEECADVRLIDCGGVDSPLHTLAALATTAETDFPAELASGLSGVITCAKPQWKELEGVPVTIAMLAGMSKTYNRPVELLSLIPTMIPTQGGAISQAEKDHDRKYAFRLASGYREMLAAAEDTYGPLLKAGVTPPVRRTNLADHAMTALTPLPLYRPADTRDVVADYSRVIEHQTRHGLFARRAAIAA
ncbi:hypothetical protein GCM10027262_78870 [Nocardia tengchongensis]